MSKPECRKQKYLDALQPIRNITYLTCKMLICFYKKTLQCRMKKSLPKLEVLPKCVRKTLCNSNSKLKLRQRSGQHNMQTARGDSKSVGIINYFCNFSWAFFFCFENVFLISPILKILIFLLLLCFVIELWLFKFSGRC